MNAFVTGGSGFLGRQLITKLITQGHTVHALARSTESAAELLGLGATVVMGDITQIETLREGMAQTDVVFHLATHRNIASHDWRTAELINVHGTRNVLSLAHELGVSRIIYTSTIEIFGDTEQQLVDESYYTEKPLANHYERTKWQAYYQVVQPLIRQGAPITVVMPGLIYGPDDPSVMGDLMRRFYFDLAPFPLLPGPSTKFAYTYIDDVVDGHLLAWEKGEAGASYILAGPAVPLGEMVDFWARITGKRPPKIHLTRSFLRPLSPIVESLSSMVNMPPIFAAEATNRFGATYMASSAKAKQELGWSPRSLHLGMLETFNHIESNTIAPTDRKKEQQIAIVALTTAVVLLIAWLLFGRGKNKR